MLSKVKTLFNQIIIEEQLRRSSSDKKDIGIPIRSDHGSLMLGDINLGERFYPGYSTIGRMKGLAELSGIELGLRHKILGLKKNNSD